MDPWPKNGKIFCLHAPQAVWPGSSLRPSAARETRPPGGEKRCVSFSTRNGKALSMAREYLHARHAVGMLFQHPVPRALMSALPKTTGTAPEGQSRPSRMSDRCMATGRRRNSYPFDCPVCLPSRKPTVVRLTGHRPQRRFRATRMTAASRRMVSGGGRRRRSGDGPPHRLSGKRAARPRSGRGIADGPRGLLRPAARPGPQPNRAGSRAATVGASSAGGRPATRSATSADAAGAV